jgi:hypothetical protein
MSEFFPDLPTDRSALLERIRADLERVNALRSAARASPALAEDRAALRAWQTDRLARTYRDLLDHPRYRPAAEFFLSDLYGPKDFAERDEEIGRIVPMLASVLPLGAVQSLALAIELDALSEELDTNLIAELRRAQARNGRLLLDEQTYAQAYRACDNRRTREAQIALLDAIARLLDRVAHTPLVTAAVELMRVPARLAGLSTLHDFLERGLQAFRHMQSAQEFIATVHDRETAILDRLLAGTPDPFAPTPPYLNKI